MNDALEAVHLITATLSLDREDPKALFYAAGWASSLAVEWFEQEWVVQKAIKPIQ